MVTLDRDPIRDTFRQRVLEALDAAANETFGQLGLVHRNDSGATDADLPRLFKALDEQVDVLAERYGVCLADLGAMSHA